MPLIENTMKRKAEAGQPVFSFNMVISRTVASVGIAAATGFDWLFIDTEHNTMDTDNVSAMCMAALTQGVTPVVRVAGHETHHTARALDGGAQGIIVPHVNSVAEAEQVVRNCKFPPLGERSLTAPAAQLGFEAMAPKDAIAALNDETFVIVMVETPEAVVDVEAIAAVEGVDCVLIGTNDLAATMGIPGQIGHDDIAKAYQTVIDACRKHGKQPGMGGVYDHALMEKYVRMGCTVCQGGGDTAFMIAAAKERSAFLRDLTASVTG